MTLIAGTIPAIGGALGNSPHTSEGICSLLRGSLLTAKGLHKHPQHRLSSQDAQDTIGERITLAKGLAGSGKFIPCSVHT